MWHPGISTDTLFCGFLNEHRKAASQPADFEKNSFEETRVRIIHNWNCKSEYIAVEIRNSTALLSDEESNLRTDFKHRDLWNSPSVVSQIFRADWVLNVQWVALIQRMYFEKNRFQKIVTDSFSFTELKLHGKIFSAKSTQFFQKKIVSVRKRILN